ncbi:unnamed protein product, partial [Durusdinium trenchii]
MAQSVEQQLAPWAGVQTRVALFKEHLVARLAERPKSAIDAHNCFSIFAFQGVLVDAFQVFTQGVGKERLRKSLMQAFPCNAFTFTEFLERALARRMVWRTKHKLLHRCAVRKGRISLELKRHAAKKVKHLLWRVHYPRHVSRPKMIGREHIFREFEDSIYEVATQ